MNLGTFVVLGVPIQWVLFYFKNYKVRSSPENGGVSVGMGQSSIAKEVKVLGQKQKMNDERVKYTLLRTPNTVVLIHAECEGRDLVSLTSFS